MPWKFTNYNENTYLHVAIFWVYPLKLMFLDVLPNAVLGEGLSSKHLEVSKGYYVKAVGVV
jgi:hypothetical protein